jgi:hypothetical protein
MHTHELIGRTITDIFVWYSTEVGGLDEAEVFIKLDNDAITGIPWEFDSSNLKKPLREGAESVFANLSKIPIIYVNPGGISIEEIITAKKKRDATITGRIKQIFGLNDNMPAEYKPYKTEFVENPLKHVKMQKIVDFLTIDDAYSAGYLELENGFIITETTFSPHGTGMAGLNYYKNLTDFEECCGTNYHRLKNNKIQE